MTQEQLAGDVGTTKAVISLLESGRRGLSDKWLRRLAIPLKTRPGWLLDHDPTDMPRDFLDIAQQLSGNDLEQASKILEIFVKNAS